MARATADGAVHFEAMLLLLAVCAATSGALAAPLRKTLQFG